jgi:hypothetical protein
LQSSNFVVEIGLRGSSAPEIHISMQSHLLRRFATGALVVVAAVTGFPGAASAAAWPCSRTLPERNRCRLRFEIGGTFTPIDVRVSVPTLAD